MFISDHPVLFSLCVIAVIWLIVHYAHKNSDRNKALNERETCLDARTAELEKRESRLSTRKEELDAKYLRLWAEQQKLRRDLADIPRIVSEQVEERANEITRTKLARFADLLRNRPYFRNSLVFEHLSRSVGDIASDQRLLAALTMVPLANRAEAYPLFVSTHMHGSSGEIYEVSLDRCTCKDFQYKGAPCKHMYLLALDLGLLLETDKDKFLQFRRDATRAALDVSRLELATEDNRKSEERLGLKIRQLDTKEKEYRRIISDSKQTYPYLAKLIVDYDSQFDSDWIEQKKNSAPKTAKELSKYIRKKTVEFHYQRRIAEHQLAVYESLFPWLLDFKELSPDEAVAEISAAVQETSVSDGTCDSLREWLAPHEYAKLSDPEKYQLALDRWREQRLYLRDTSAWAAGRAYERYVGYLYESKGYKVAYVGALMRKEDMGRDLIASKGDEVQIIQCKRYRETKQLHENTVFQLFGSTVHYTLEHPDKTVKPVIYTTAPLSSVASRCAELLHIIVERCPFDREYPLIKCNIGRHGDKIYHLPFDQQYDHVQIDISAGECYASTIAEAEALGFRRAYRWKGANAKA